MQRDRLTPFVLGLAAAVGCSAAAFAQQTDAPADAAPQQQAQPQRELDFTQLAPMRGYLEAHRDLQQPYGLLGGAIEVRLRQDAGGAHVALPAQRKLDPRVFGQADLPLAYGGTPIVTGLPPHMRQRRENQPDLAQPLSPFGDRSVVMPEARLQLRALDSTATDAARSRDRIELTAQWQDPEGNTYQVQADEIIPHGLEYPVFGGVVTNHVIHGVTGVGSALMPTEFAYLAFWGRGDVMKNGQLLEENRIVHGMLTEYVRGEGYELVFDPQVDPTRVHFHLLVPPVTVADGKFQDQPVQTGFEMENGQPLPFWHVMFNNLEISAQRAQPMARQPRQQGDARAQPAAFEPGGQPDRPQQQPQQPQQQQQQQQRQGEAPSADQANPVAVDTQRGIEVQDWQRVVGDRDRPSAAQPQQPQPQQAEPAEAAATVGMTDELAYQPRHVTIQQGETILWRNNSELVHTVTADPELASEREHVRLPAGAQPFNSGRLQPGQTYQRRFTAPGEYRYFCIPHEAAGMTGTITVEAE